MLKINQIKGVVFDVDDTLLDNGGGKDHTQGLHALSRLAAVYEVAETHDVPQLKTLTPQQNVEAFITARTHSLGGAVWNILKMKGLVDTDEIDQDNELFTTIVERKNALHEPILLERGIEVPGARHFIQRLADTGLTDKLAIASSAVARDIRLFLGKYDLDSLFPANRIVSIEKTTKPKPDPQAFELGFLSLELPDIDRRSVLAFDDDPRGLMSAKAAGLYVCAITTKFAKDDPLLLATRPDVIFDSFAEYETAIF